MKEGESQLKRIIHNVLKTMHMLLKVRRPNMTFSRNWPGNLKNLKEYKLGVKVTKVIQKFSPQEWIKYNIDRASRRNLKQSSCAFCLRDENGDLIHVEGTKMDNTTNTLAQAKAILEVSKHCKQSQYDKVIIQTDSMLLKKILEEEQSCPWSIAGRVEEIKSYLCGKQIKFQHILRKGNQLAGYLANLTIDKGNYCYLHFQSMKSTSRRTINSDKLKCSYLRVNLLRNNGTEKAKA